jgi:hypothetical protein
VGDPEGLRELSGGHPEHQRAGDGRVEGGIVGKAGGEEAELGHVC